MSNTLTSHGGLPRRERSAVGRYRCLADPLPELSGHRVCTLRERDIQSIRVWRNAQMDILRQAAPITAPEQQRYFKEVVTPDFRAREPRQILLSLLFEESCIGYTGLTNIDWRAKRAEVSFLLDPARAANPDLYRQGFGTCLELLSRTAFELLGFHRLFAETFDLRPLHVAILEAHGYRLEGRMREHVRIAGTWVDSLIHGLLAPQSRER